MIHVAGIDVSLSNTGVAVIRDGAVKWGNVESSPTRSGEDPDGAPLATLLDRRNRIRNLARRVVERATHGLDVAGLDHAPLFVIEAPLYRAPMRRDPKTQQLVPITGGGHAHDRAWLWGLVVDALYRHGLVVEVSTTTMKRYATGKGSGRKAGVLAAMQFMYPGEFVTDDNAADALALAAMGARALGFPVEPSPQRVTPSALASVAWPNTSRGTETK